TQVKQEDITTLAGARAQKPRSRRRVLASATDQDGQPEAAPAEAAEVVATPAAEVAEPAEAPVVDAPVSEVSDESKTAETTAQ
ncbi:MAG: hypothetical protein ACYSOV_04595, partial [Planctomycetota bacterium]